MDDGEKARWLKGVTETIRDYGGFRAVAIIALDDDGVDTVMTPDCSTEGLRALLRGVLELQTAEVQVERQTPAPSGNPDKGS